MIEDDDRTAAAGHARDWAEVGGDDDSEAATNGTTDGATHPGDGTDAYWSEGESYDNSAGNWFGSQVTREVAQNLSQNHKPMTIQQWEQLSNAEKIGDFWIIDHETGWAYWASQLNPGETTSYLLDAAEMTSEADAINGSYYYGIHVASELISPEEEFSDEITNESENLLDLLEGIRNGAIDEEDGNPPSTVSLPPSRFNFEIMNPGRIFTMAGEQYRYLENMEEGYHLIIRNQPILNRSFNQQNEELDIFYSSLNQEVQNIVQPVSIPSPVPGVVDGDITFPTFRWLPHNLTSFPEVASDLTSVEEEGRKRAFALSLADVVRLSQNGSFTSRADRAGLGNTWWFLRTPSTVNTVWHVHGAAGGSSGALSDNIGHLDVRNNGGGIRPALIVKQEF